LSKINFPEDKINEVLNIIAHHHFPGDSPQQNLKIVYDADMIVNFKGYNVSVRKKIKQIIKNIF
jgi:hypothetical protein